MEGQDGQQTSTRISRNRCAAPRDSQRTRSVPDKRRPILHATFYSRLFSDLGPSCDENLIATVCGRIRRDPGSSFAERDVQLESDFRWCCSRGRRILEVLIVTSRSYLELRPKCDQRRRAGGSRAGSDVAAPPDLRRISTRLSVIL